jgi:hypothetical protein
LVTTQSNPLSPADHALARDCAVIDEKTSGKDLGLQTMTKWVIECVLASDNAGVYPLGNK